MDYVGSKQIQTGAQHSSKSFQNFRRWNMRTYRRSNTTSAFYFRVCEDH